MMLRAADLFCGAGGSTTGAEQSGAVRVVYALNHWSQAIRTHSDNHPHVKHICAPIESVNPHHDVPAIDLLMASPECTHHSIARGGRPCEDQKRATGWHVVQWAEACRPKWIVVENVREYLHWGPIGCDGRPLKSKRGETFAAWVQALESLRYTVEWRLLNAADFGAPTKRIRLFVIARRGGGRIPWPVATHADAWRPAADVIDWSRPCPSIFTRKRPLAEKTLRRIAIGLAKFCGDAPKPFVVNLKGTSTAMSIDQPTPTITAGAGHVAIATPFIVPNFGERDGQTPRTHAIDRPLPAVTGHGAGALVMPYLVDVHDQRRDDRSSSVLDPLPTIVAKPGNSLVMPYLIDVNHGDGGQNRDRSYSIDRPLGAITGSRGQAMVLAFVTQYNGTGKAQSIDEPLTTVTAKPRHGLALVQVMQELGVADIGFRMLDVDELALAQGFPAGYRLDGNKADQIRQVGNAVCPPVMRAICTAIAGV